MIDRLSAPMGRVLLPEFSKGLCAHVSNACERSIMNMNDVPVHRDIMHIHGEEGIHYNSSKQEFLQLCQR